MIVLIILTAIIAIIFKAKNKSNMEISDSNENIAYEFIRYLYDIYFTIQQ